MNIQKPNPTAGGRYVLGDDGEHLPEKVESGTALCAPVESGERSDPAPRSALPTERSDPAPRSALPTEAQSADPLPINVKPTKEKKHGSAK